MKKQKVFHLPFNVAPYKSFVDEIIYNSRRASGCFVCVANVHTLIESYRNTEFANQVRKADIIAPDGIPITWALRLLYHIRQDRVAGMDLLPDVLKGAEKEDLPVYFYGGTQSMLEKTLAYTSKHYPCLRISGMFSPPFRSLSAAEEEDIIAKINNAGARIVLVALGCPKQEKWIAEMKGRIKATMIGIGGALPVMIGMKSRAPVWMQRSGLEWLFRLAQDPKRLWKRYFVTNSIFICLFIQMLITSKIKFLLSGRDSL